MCDLIGLHVLDMLIGRAPVIDLVKIHAVIPAGAAGHRVLLVQQHAVHTAHIQKQPILIVQRQLPQLHGQIPGCDAQEPGPEHLPGGLGVLPFKQVRIALGHGRVIDLPVLVGLGVGIFQGHPVAAVGAVLQPVGAGIQARVVHHSRKALSASQVDNHLLILLRKGIKALRRLVGAQVHKGHHRIDRHQAHDHRQVPPLHGAALAVQAELWPFKIVYPLQGAHTWGHIPAVFDEKGHDQRHQQRKQHHGRRPDGREISFQRLHHILHLQRFYFVLRILDILAFFPVKCNPYRAWTSSRLAVSGKYSVTKSTWATRNSFPSR